MSQFVHLPLRAALSAQAMSSLETMGARELGLFVDAFPDCRGRFMPPLRTIARECLAALTQHNSAPTPEGPTLVERLAAAMSSAGMAGTCGKSSDFAVSLGVLGTQELLSLHGTEILQSLPPDVILLHPVARCGPATVVCAVVYQVTTGAGKRSGQVLRSNSAAEFGDDFALLCATRLPGSHVDRRACAEFRALSELAKILSEMSDTSTAARLHGLASVYVTEPPCFSCVFALMQFSQLFPYVSIAVFVDGTLLRYSHATSQDTRLEPRSRQHRRLETVQSSLSYWDAAQEDLLSDT